MSETELQELVDMTFSQNLFIQAHPEEVRQLLIDNKRQCLPKSVTDIECFFKEKDYRLRESQSIVEHIKFIDFVKAFNKDMFLEEYPKFEAVFRAIETVEAEGNSITTC